MTHKYRRAIQIVLMITGISLLAIFVTAHIYRKLLSQIAVEQFRKVEAQRVPERSAKSFAERHFTFDFDLWSPQRIADYEKSLTANLEPPIAILRIAKAHLEVPVLNGVDDLTLNRGVGYIPGTAYPGEPGNVGIAGHRDGFFRVLKNVETGDMVELETLDRIETYRINDIVIVDKKDSSVLRPSSIPILTLVTCYPFYFIGNAPKRYIVVASLITSGLPRDVNQTSNTSSALSEPAAPDKNPQSQKPTKEIPQ